MTTAVDFWFDPLCPWAWMTSRWMLEVEQVRDVHTTFHIFSLAVLNEGHDIPEKYRKGLESGWLGTKAAVGVKEQYGDEGVRRYYTTLGTLYHPGGQPKTLETLQQALEEGNFDPRIAERARTDEWEQAVRDSTKEALDLVGGEVGTPVIKVNGMALFGPVISPAPKGEQAGELFDGFEKMTAYPGFFELKRTRTVDPIFD